MATMKKMRTLGRKALSLLLTLTMVTSMIQIPAMAAYEDQTMEGWYVINENGRQGTTTEGVVSQDGFTLSKTIAQTGKDAFDITLTVETSQTVTTNDAAVQLIIDTSSSMETCSINCGRNNCSKHGDRLDAIKKILTETNGFLDDLTASNNGKILVSVISFNAHASAVCDWQDIKTAAGMKAVKDAVNGLNHVTGTNIQAGLLLAKNRLGMSAVSNCAAKYAVLLSDGEAYRSAKNPNSTSTTYFEGTQSGNHTANAKAAAELLKPVVNGNLYGVGYGVKASDLNNVLGYTNSPKVIVGNDSDAVSKAFANIATSAVSGMNGSGTNVTDPMGQYIVLGGIPAEAAAKGASAENGIITWELNPATATVTENGDTTTYTYSITYPITLDTSAEGFQEGVYYPTNGRTSLNVPQAEGTKKIDFPVPGVCGTIPEYEWAIEYWLQDESSINADEADFTYTLNKTVNKQPADLHTTVNAPEGYADAYTSSNYSFHEGNTSLKITADPANNVIRLYYILDTAPVTEKHYYKTTTISYTGETTVGAYEIDPNKTTTKLAVIDSKYTAIEQPTFGGNAFSFDEAKPASKTITVKENGENLVELFYSRTVDLRVDTTAQVNHTYTEFKYELVNGKYELDNGTTLTEEKVQYSEEVHATEVFAVGKAPVEGYTGYELTDTDGTGEIDGELSFVLAEDGAENIRTLGFEKVTDNREAVNVTVNHWYTKSVTTIENGEAVTTIDPNNELGLIENSFEAYKGESFTAEESNEFEGDLYNSDESNAGKLHIDALTGDVTIDLYYNLTLVPEKAGVIANHYWRTFTEVTVETIDEATGEVTGSDIEIRETIDNSIEGIEYNDLYLGERHIEAQQSWGEGYTFNAEDSTIEVIAGSGIEADLFYDKWAEADERSDADITVLHKYTTYLTTIIDGQTDVLVINESSDLIPFEGLKAGEEFTATAEPIFNGNEFLQITDEAALTVMLQPGTNATIVIEYQREADDRIETAWSADYLYNTYIMSVNELGEAGYWNAPESTDDFASGDGFVGEKITLDPKAIEGFTALATNPGINQTLADGENHWSFVYEQFIPLDPGTVTVNHHYTTHTIGVNGQMSTATQDVWGAPQTRYIGEAFTAEAVPNGFTQTGLTVYGAAAELAAAITVNVGPDMVIDFYYEKTDDFSIPVNYTIAHEYYLYDWDGTLISESKPAPVTGTGFASNALVVAPDAADYELVSATFNGAEMNGNYNLVLQEGENNVLFIYEKTIPQDFVDVTVIHNYWKDEAAMETAQPEQQYTQVTSNVPEASTFAAEIRDLAGYEFFSAQPESMEIIVNDDGDNVIILNYTRCEAAYKVEHIYFANGELEGSTSEIIGGLHGDVIDAETIPQILTYGGNEFTFTSVSGDVTLAAGEIPVITLTYNRYFEIITEPETTEVIVIHEFYENEDAIDGEPETTDTERFDNQPIGEEFTAEPKEDTGYTPVTPDTELVITTEDGDNVIIIRYVRSEASYKVIHIYNRAGVEEGRTEETIGGLHGDEIDAESIEQIPVYNGREYTFQSVTADIVLDADEEKTITLIYNRNAGIRPPDRDPDPIPDPEVEIPEEPVPLDGDFEIPDHDVPLAELPDEEVPLAEVPKTGDESFRFTMMALASALGLAVLTLTRKREEEV